MQVRESGILFEGHISIGVLYQKSMGGIGWLGNGNLVHH